MTPWTNPLYSLYSELKLGIKFMYLLKAKGIKI